jgi:hypothetical protein
LGYVLYRKLMELGVFRCTLFTEVFSR